MPEAYIRGFSGLIYCQNWSWAQERELMSGLYSMRLMHGIISQVQKGNESIFTIGPALIVHVATQSNTQDRPCSFRDEFKFFMRL